MFKKLKVPEIIQPYTGVIYFTIILLVSHFLWKLLMIGDESDVMVTFLGINLSAPFNWAAHHIAEVCTSIIRGLGMEVYLIKDNVIIYPNGNAVQIVWGCTGIKQAYIFICIIAFYRGPWKHKLWYIPVGLVVVYLFNIFRIAFIAATIRSHPEWFHFLHGILFKYLFYVAIFGMWVVWEEVFVKRDTPPNLPTREVDSAEV